MITHIFCCLSFPFLFLLGFTTSPTFLKAEAKRSRGFAWHQRMPRFSLGSRQNSSNTHSPFLLRFQLQKDRLQTWWRHLLHPNNSAASVSNHSSTGNNNNSNTRDWRSLSPNEPPLPFIASLTESSPNSGTNASATRNANHRSLDSSNNNNNSNNGSSSTGGRFSKGFARAIRIAPQTNSAAQEAQQVHVYRYARDHNNATNWLQGTDIGCRWSRSGSG